MEAHPEMPDRRISRGITKFKSGVCTTNPAVPDRAEAGLKPDIAYGAVVFQWILNLLRL